MDPESLTPPTGDLSNIPLGDDGLPLSAKDLPAFSAYLRGRPLAERVQALKAVCRKLSPAAPVVAARNDLYCDPSTPVASRATAPQGILATLDRLDMQADTNAQAHAQASALLARLRLASA